MSAPAVGSDDRFGSAARDCDGGRDDYRAAHKLRGKVALVTGSTAASDWRPPKRLPPRGAGSMLSARSTEQLRETETALRATVRSTMLTKRSANSSAKFCRCISAAPESTYRSWAWTILLSSPTNR